jgi:transposase
MDLRERIVWTYLEGGVSEAEVADQFCVGKSTVGKLVRQYKASKCLKPRTHLCGRKPAISGEQESALIQHVQEHPDATTQERRDALKLTCSTNTVWQTIRRLNARFKKRRSKAPNNNAKTWWFSERTGTPVSLPLTRTALFSLMKQL